MKRAAIYLREPTADQPMASQESDLREIAARSGLEIVQVYKDHG
jgi:DNA invertase Pin-like site-specific DNA recombinase